MIHRKLQSWLSEYVDGMLDSAQQATVEDHLKKCAACRNLLHSLKTLHQLDLKTQTMQPNAFFAQKVLRQYDSLVADKIWQVFDFIPRRLVLAGITFSMLIFAFVITSYFRTNTSELESEYRLLFDQSSAVVNVSDDEALAIALTADSFALNGE